MNIAGTSTSNNPVLVKYDASGTAQWAKTITGGTGSAEFRAVAVDGSGNVYAAGSQYGTGNYNYGTVSIPVNIAGACTNGNPVLVKYNASGTALRVETITAGTASASFKAVAVNGSGIVYAAGYQSAGNFNYGSGTLAGTSATENPVLVKYWN